MAQQGNLEKLLEKAEQALKRNNFDYAIQILQQLLKMDPDNEKGNSIFFLSVQKKWKQAGKTPKPSKTNVMKLWIDRKRKKWDAVADKCRDTHIKDPMNAKVVELLAEAELNQKHYNACLAATTRLLELDNKHVLGWFWKGKSLAELDKIEEAIECVTKAMELDKANKVIHDYYRDLSARHTISRKKLDQAKSFRDVVDKDAVREAIQRDKKLTKEEILENIKEMGGLEACKTNKDARKIGELYAEMDDYPNAVKAFKKANELNPTDVEALDRAGDYTIKYYQKKVRDAKKQGNDEKVREFRKKLLEYQIQEYERRVKLRPTDLELAYKLGTFFYQARKFKDAVKELQKARRDAKRKIDCDLMLGRCFLELGSFDLALRTLNELLNDERLIEEKRKDALYWTGHTYFRKGEKSKAKEVWMDLQAIDFDYKDVAELIKKCG